MSSADILAFPHSEPFPPAQVLDLARGALRDLPAEARENVAVFAGINDEDFPALRRELNDAILHILAKYSGSERADAVVAVALQAFPIYRTEG